MASLQRYRSAYHLAFRYQGQRFLRSLETTDQSEAREIKALVERTLRRLKEGELDPPAHLTSDQLWQFLRSGGRAKNLPSVIQDVRLDHLCQRYLDSHAATTKDRSTLATEQLHLNHFQRLLGNSRPATAVDAAALRGYRDARLAEQGTYGRTVRPVTVSKEMQTFRQLWEFGRTEKLVNGINPATLVKKPRGSQKQRFMAWDEIEQRIARGGLAHDEVAELWEALFLREAEIGDFLQHVKQVSAALPRFPFIHPALTFCAYTGARRSEMFRCRVDDVRDCVLLREKKKSQRQEITFREVPLHPALKMVIDRWLDFHPGGQYLFCKNSGTPLDDKTSREAFGAVTKTSKWNVLRGYHVLRHSFASNLARHGIDQYKIDAFMGHQTEDMRKRYRHLFPEDREAAISVLRFSATG